MSNSKSVRQQVEKILDEESGRVHSVIVQMDSDEGELRAMMEASAEALQRRHLTVSARSLVPPKAALIRKDSKYTSYDRRLLRSSGEALTSQVALAAVSAVAVAGLRVAGLEPVANLMSSELVKEAIAGALRRSKKDEPRKGLPEGFRSFWSSQSAVLRLERDELRKIVDLEKVSAVFPNSEVRLPPVAEVTAIPQALLDSKTSAWGIEKTSALAAWGAYGTKGAPLRGTKPVRVAVLDTGVDPTHPELAGKVADWAEFDGHGEEVIGSTPYDSGEHGTHVCGTICGGTGGVPSADSPIIGMAPDVKLAVGLVLKGRSGTYAQILAGMEWAIEQNVEAINMSLGGVAFEPDVRDIYSRQIINANLLGIPVIVSIGNEGAQTSGPPANDYFAFAVGATDHRDQPGGFSGGRTLVIRESRFIDPQYLPLVYMKPDLSAPGVAVRSSIPNGKYAVWNGTSMAAPHVTGAAALLLAATDIRSIPKPRRAALIQDLLISSVDELGESGKDHRYGFGRVNVLRAIGSAKELGY